MILFASFSSYGKAGTVHLNWIATGDDYWEGTAHTYDIRISDKPFMWEWARPLLGEPRPDTSGTPQSWAIGGLEQGRIYWIGMKVYDEVRNSSPLMVWRKVARGIEPPRIGGWR